MTTRIYRSKGHFNKRKDWLGNGVSKAFSEQHPFWEKQNESNGMLEFELELIALIFISWIMLYLSYNNFVVLRIDKQC